MLERLGRYLQGRPRPVRRYEWQVQLKGPEGYGDADGLVAESLARVPAKDYW